MQEEVGKIDAASVSESNKTILQDLEAVRIQLNGQASSLDQQVQSAIQPSLGELGKRFQKQLDVQAARLDEHVERLDKHDVQLQALQGELV
eukprot:8487976-Pyramimonas_sp.AAC.1